MSASKDSDNSGKTPATSGRARGRPRREHRRDIADALLDITEEILKQEGFSAVTERKVATLAGVSEATIPYYFGDKNGLLFAVVDRCLAFIEESLGTLMDIDAEDPQCSLHFARILIKAHHTRPWIAHLMTAEQQRHDQSPIWERFVRRRGPRSLVQVRDALLRMTTARYGRASKDEQYAMRVSMSLLCVSTGTLSWYTLSEGVGIRFDDLWQAPWLQHVADLVDYHCYLLAGGSGAALRALPLPKPP